MKIKKLNALLSLLTIVAAFLHVGYTAYSYLTFYYNPMLKNIMSIPFMILACLHMVLAMCIVFLSSDGTSLSTYPRQNITTILQRVSAAFIVPMLILHINTFNLLQNCVQNKKMVLFFLLIISQPVFYLTVFTHVALSLSRALITLGLISSLKVKKTIDLIACIVCAIVCIVASWAVIKVECSMFLTVGGAL